MNELNRKLNAQAELEASGEALAAAQALLANGLLRSAVSRLYYAVFHLVRALLVSQGLDPRTHEGVETLFGLHFVRAGILDKRFGRLFAHVQKFREQADYGPVLVLSADEIERDVEAVKEFAAEVQRILDIKDRTA